MDTQETGLASSATQSKAHTPVVLLVEDEAVVREITGRVLENAGYRVLESGSASEALHLASKHAGRLDLLLTDVVMPGMTGIDLADQLRSLQPDLVTVFMSGYAEGDIQRRISVTSTMHIQKPFTVNSLLSRIAEALSASASREPLRRAV